MRCKSYYLVRSNLSTGYNYLYGLKGLHVCLFQPERIIARGLLTTLGAFVTEITIQSEDLSVTFVR